MAALVTQSRTATCLVGWIVGTENSRQDLEDMGITVGEFSPTTKSFEACIVPEEAFSRLEPLWMSRYMWGLDKKVSFALDASPEELSDEQLLAARAFWKGKINGPENDGRLTADSSAWLDIWMDKVATLNEVIEHRNASIGPSM